MVAVVIAEGLLPPSPGVSLLIDAVQRLAMARDVAAVQEIVRHSARHLTGADGATFVLRDGDRRHTAGQHHRTEVNFIGPGDLLPAGRQDHPDRTADPHQQAAAHPAQVHRHVEALHGSIGFTW